MGLRQWVKDMLSRMGRSKVQTLNSAEEVKSASLDQSDEVFTQNSEVLEEAKEFVANPEELKFEDIQKEVRSVLLENAKKFSQTLLNNEQIKALSSDDAKTGKMGNKSFVCIIEEVGQGEYRTTIVTEDSCIKMDKDTKGNLTYQETRKVGDELKTIINTKDSSLSISGNVSQTDINKIKNFSEINKLKLSKSKTFADDKQNETYKKNILKKLGIESDFDINDSEKYAFCSTGRITRDKDNRITRLDEMSFALDKKNPHKKPLVISLNTLDDEKLKERKFFLTNNGKYIDESSIVFDEKGEPTYKEYSLKQIKELGNELKLDTKLVDRIQKAKQENKSLIPGLAEKLHGALVRTRQDEKAKAQAEAQKQAQEENAGQTQGGQSQNETSGETQQTQKNQGEDLER